MKVCVNYLNRDDGVVKLSLMHTERVSARVRTHALLDVEVNIFKYRESCTGVRYRVYYTETQFECYYVREEGRRSIILMLRR